MSPAPTFKHQKIVFNFASLLRDALKGNPCVAGGVKEYIVVDPAAQYVERFLLEEGGLYEKSEIFGPKEVLPLVFLKKIDIPLWEIFEVEEPKDQEKKEQCIPIG